MAALSIVRQYQAQEIGTQGKLISVIHVDFNVGDDGPFSVSIPVAEYTADRARAEVEKLAQEIANVQLF